MTGTIQFDGFKAGDSYPASINSVFYAHGWVTGSLQTITADITLPKRCPENLSATIHASSLIARGISGYVNNASTGIISSASSVLRRSDYVLTVSFSFDTPLTNVTNNTPVALYITGRIDFS